VNGSDNVDLTERARAAVYAGPPRRTIGNDDAIFDHDDPKIKEVGTFRFLLDLYEGSDGKRK